MRASGSRWVSVGLVACSAWLGACGGAPASKTPADSPATSSTEPASDDKSLPEGQDIPPEGPAKSPSSSESADATDPAPPPQAAKSADPEFRAGMSVNEAINAVPTGTERVNIDQETLEAPILRPELYAPCKLGPSQHFKVRVAIWEGRAVGLDIEATPKNEKIVACLREQIEGVRWSPKAKSLNTVEYSY